MKLKSFLLLLSIAFVYSCASKTAPQPEKKVVNEIIETEEKETSFNFSNTVLTENQIQGKELYDAKCASCHKLYATTDFSDEKWVRILKRMQPKAKINDAQREQIYDYITSGM